MPLKDKPEIFSSVSERKGMRVENIVEITFGVVRH